MAEYILLWVGVGLLLLLCLPISPVQKIVLEVSAWGLRLGMIALLAAGAYLWFRPGEMPVGVSRVLNDFPGLLSLMPAQGSQAFGLCLAACIVAMLVPLLAVLDVSRRLAGRRLCRIRALTAEPVAVVREVEPLPLAEEPAPVGVPVLRPIERQTAAATIAAAGTHAH